MGNRRGRNERGGGSFNRNRDRDSFRGGRDRDERPPRPKLEWKDEDTLQQGNARAQLTSAVTQRGDKLYSVNFFKEYNGRRSGHFRHRDLDDVSALCEQVQHWIQADQDERQKGERHAHRTA